MESGIVRVTKSVYLSTQLSSWRAQVRDNGFDKASQEVFNGSQDITITNRKSTRTARDGQAQS